MLRTTFLRIIQRGLLPSLGSYRYYKFIQNTLTSGLVENLVCIQKKVISMFFLFYLISYFYYYGLYRFKKLIFKTSLTEHKTIIFYNFCLKSLNIKKFHNILSSLNFFSFLDYVKYKELMIMYNLIDHNFVLFTLYPMAKRTHYLYG